MAAKIRTCWCCTGRCVTIEGVEFRFHRTILYNSIYRGDEHLLVNTHIYGVPAAALPGVASAQGGRRGDRVSTYLESFERVWDSAVPVPG